MAGEIVVLNGNKKERYGLLFWYSIPTGVRKYVGGGTSGTLVVCCPSSSLPVPSDTQLDTGKRLALDDGTALFTRMTVDMTGYTNAQAIARAQDLYNDTDYQQGLLADYEAVYGHYGRIIDAS